MHLSALSIAIRICVLFASITPLLFAVQHDRIWKLYLKWVREGDVPPETAIRIYRRYLQASSPSAHSFSICAGERTHASSHTPASRACVRPASSDSRGG
jgi:hypothetical protein